jgi:RimJ/RimL family protein N-acetyltransferase
MDFFNESPQWDNLELGWRFKQSAWGKGYGTEAAKAIIAALQQQKGYRRFAAIALQGNDASCNIMKKLGMKYVKTDLHKDPLGDMEVLYYQLDLA